MPLTAAGEMRWSAIMRSVTSPLFDFFLFPRVIGPRNHKGQHILEITGMFVLWRIRGQGV